jgi:hypothetical protein
MKRNFGLRSRIEPAEMGAGAVWVIFVATIIVVWLAFIHP